MQKTRGKLKIHQKLENSNFPRVFYIFFTFFYHFACKDAKIHQKLEKSNFPRVFYIFLHFFIILLAGCQNSPKFGKKLEEN